MRVDGAMTGEFVDALFAESPSLPGVIMMDGDRVAALIARRTFYALVDRSFSRQVFWRRPISVLVESLESAPPTVLRADVPIPGAVEAALARPASQVFDPLIVENGVSLHLLEVDVLLRAHAGVLAAAHSENDYLLAEIARLNRELTAMHAQLDRHTTT